MHVSHLLTASAQKVTMGFGVAVVSVGAVNRDFDNRAVFTKKTKVSVNRAQAEIGKILFQAPIQRLGGGVVRP